MQILIRAPKELKELLQIRAKRMGITLNALILQILWDWIRQQEEKRRHKLSRLVAGEKGKNGMTIQEYEERGGCIGCLFYSIVDVDGRRACTFHWFDDETDDWEMDRNCKEAKSSL